MNEIPIWITIGLPLAIAIIASFGWRSGIKGLREAKEVIPNNAWDSERRTNNINSADATRLVGKLMTIMSFTWLVWEVYSKFILPLI